MPASKEMLIKNTPKLSLAITAGSLLVGVAGTHPKAEHVPPGNIFFEPPMPSPGEGHISYKAKAAKLAIKRVHWEERRRELAKQARYAAPTNSTTTLGAAAGIPSILVTIGQCESGGGPGTSINYTAQNPTTSASGGFQITNETWGGYAGYAAAKYAPPAIQVQRAEQLLAESGTSPWVASQHCWG
jgi:hypothetical protein